MTRILTMMVLAVCALTLLGLETAQGAPANFTGLDGRSVLEDPEWRARFLGSYGFLSDVEPQIKTDELELLREVIDLMQANPKAAATMLGAQVSPDSSASLDYILGNLHFQNGDLAEASEAYQKALEKFPAFQRAHKNAGLLILQTNDYSGALQHLTKAVALGDRDGRTYGLIGYCYLNLENYLPAEEAYRTAVLLEPDSRDWKLGLARSLQAMEKNEEAVAHFGALIEADPADAMAWKGQANAYLGLGQPRAAAVNLEALRIMGEADLSTLELLGNIYMNEGIPGLAESAYAEVVAQDQGGTNFETGFRAAELLERTRSYPEARSLLGTIEKKYGDSLTPDQQLEILTLQAKIARGQGREKEAAKLLTSIVERDGTRGDALIELAAYYNDQGDSARAFMLIERAQNVDSTEYAALIKHAQFRVAAKQYDEAAALLQRALRIQKEPRIERYLARVQAAQLSQPR